eukprot:6271459-Prymnesium_polylepis.1
MPTPDLRVAFTPAAESQLEALAPALRLLASKQAARTAIEEVLIADPRSVHWRQARAAPRRAPTHAHAGWRLAHSHWRRRGVGGGAGAVLWAVGECVCARCAAHGPSVAAFCPRVWPTHTAVRFRRGCLAEPRRPRLRLLDRYAQRRLPLRGRRRERDAGPAHRPVRPLARCGRGRRAAAAKCADGGGACMRL